MSSPSSSSSSSSLSSSSGATSYSDWSPRSSVHAASLVDPSTHSPELLQLVDIELSRPVIHFLVDTVSSAVSHGLERSGASLSRGRSSHRSKNFTSFVSTVLRRAEITTPIVLVALVYLKRARPHLSLAVEHWALERVFLGALILAAKYTQDSTLKNVHWALCTGLFGRNDIGRIEREFLEVLDWELGVREADLLEHREGIMRAVAGVKAARLRAKPVDVEPVVLSPIVPVEACPDLATSSPHSSIGSLSPPTPVSEATLSDAVVSLPSSPVVVSQEKSLHGQAQDRLNTLFRVLSLPKAHHGSRRCARATVRLGV